MAWHRRAGTEIALRGAGALSIAGALWAARALSGPGAVAARGGATAMDFLLAVIAFLCGTCGVALLVVGAHLFDPVDLGPRWRRFGR